MRKKRILFVCLGNICRSPTAEAAFLKKLKELGLENELECESAGTTGYHIGEYPDPRAQEHGKARGYRFETTAQQFKARDFEDFDHIVVMDASNRRNVLAHDPDGKYASKVSMMTDYCQKFKAREVPDPYFGGKDGFEEVLDLIEDAVEGLIQKFKSTVKVRNGSL